VPFVFFFLSEYSSIILFSALTSILFLGGYNLPSFISLINSPIIFFSALIFGLKTCLICFMFVWFRATLPRLRYDQLIELCWLYLLPLIVSLIITIPCLLLTLIYFI
jgi:NADH-ubiquinone oxidoreductase chain 1